MSKPYTIKEMKTIVDYLVKQKAYGEVKGRKMWVDFANTNLTQRTWQSLKETFLKRILPDIHNPYYKLTLEQVRSFRQGYDVTTKDKNKLELRPVNEEATTKNQAEVKQNKGDLTGNTTGNDKSSKKRLSNDDKGNSKGEDVRALVNKSTNNESDKSAHDEGCPDLLTHTLKDFGKNSKSSKKRPDTESQIQNLDTTGNKLDNSEKNTNILKRKSRQEEDITQNDENFESQGPTTRSRVRGDENIENNTQKKGIKNMKSLKEIHEASTQMVPESPVSISTNTQELKETEIEKTDISIKNANTFTERESDKRVRRNITTENNVMEKNCTRKNKTQPERKESEENVTSTMDPLKKTSNSCDGVSQLKISPPFDKSSLLENDIFDSTDESEISNQEEADIYKNAQEKGKTTEIGNDELRNVNIQTTINNVVLLESDSDSESDIIEPTLKTRDLNKDTKLASNQKRDKALANMFGLSSGAVTSARKKSVSVRKCVSTRYFQPEEMSSESSDCMLDLDNGYAPPSSNRKHDVMLIEPKSHRVYSSENGQLYALIDNKVYPVTKNGRKSIRDVHFRSDVLGDSDNDDWNGHKVKKEREYWKLKYIEQKKRTAEAIRQLKEAQEKIIQQSRRSAVEPLEPRPSYIDSPSKVTVHAENTVEMKEKNVKIKLMANNQEVQLEGEWPNLNPVLSKVVEMFKSPQLNAQEKSKLQPDIVETKNLNKPEDKTLNDTNSKVVNNAQTSMPSNIEPKTVSANTEVTEPNNSKTKGSDRLGLIASDNAKAIESIQTKGPNDAAVKENGSSDANNTKASVNRKAVAPKKAKEPSSDTVEISSNSSSTDASERELRARLDALEEKIYKQILETAETERSNDVKEQHDINQEPNVTKRKKIEKPKAEKTSEATAPRKLRTSNRKVEENNKDKQPTKDTSKHPTEEVQATSKTRAARKRKAKKTTVDDNKAVSEDEDDISVTKDPKNFSTSDSLLNCESSQGYQNSDISPVKSNLKKKRRFTVSALRKDKKNFSRKLRRVVKPYIMNDASSESSNLSFHTTRANVAMSSRADSALNPSESYQQAKQSLNLIENIEEMDPMHEVNITNTNDLKRVTIEIKNSVSPSTDGGNTSSISLPMSPDLSIVENVSNYKNTLSSLGNAILPLKEIDEESRNEYTISKVDVTLPLMEQNCRLRIQSVSKETQQSVLKDDIDSKTCATNVQSSSEISESLLNKIVDVNIEDNPTISNSLDERLKNLLLESNIKFTESHKTIDTQQNEDIIERDGKKNGQGRKRSSTPRKKHNTKKSKAPNIKAIVEEEFMECCSYGGRNSCPPSMKLLSPIENNLNNDTILVDKTKPLTKQRRVENKNIIKVKIQRPTKKQESDSNGIYLDGNSRIVSISRKWSAIEIDSGIVDKENEVVSDSDKNNDTVDLIHNHSETCVHAAECIENNVESLESSIFSISPSNSTRFNSNTGEDTSSLKILTPRNARENVHLHNGKCASKFMKAKEMLHSAEVTSLESIMTDDISEEISVQSPMAVSKWYLLSEDEASNTNISDVKPHEDDARVTSFDTNLLKLFPITCAIPNLSTITEASRDPDEDTKKSA